MTTAFRTCLAVGIWAALGLASSLAQDISEPTSASAENSTPTTRQENEVSATDSPQRAPWAKSLSVGAELPTAALLAVEVLPFVPAPARGEPGSVKEAEGRYLAYQLRKLMEQSTQWGPVRMLADASAGHELLITGEVLLATAHQLRLAVRISDASGLLWLEQEYQQTVQAEAYDNAPEPFILLFERIVQDAVDVRNAKSLDELNNVLSVATLRRAAWLAPDAFSDYLKRDSGIYRINRLPAENDPVFASISRVAQAQALFADAVDPNFGRFFDDIQPTYTLWRKTLFESDQLIAQYRQKAAKKSARDKSARSIYLELRELKLYQQTVRETMESFVFRMEPTQIKTQGQLVELNGTLEQQSEKWRNILGRMYEVEVGL